MYNVQLKAILTRKEGSTPGIFVNYFCLAGHAKTALVGPSVTIPITNGKLNLGTWQGIWLCEHRNHAGSRKIVVTLQGVQ